MCLFRSVVQTLNTAAVLSMQNVLLRALSDARGIVEELYQMITVKLVRQGNGSGRAAWWRNKSRIVRLHESLKEARANLLAALSADLL